MDAAESAAERLRRRLASGPLVAPGVYDGLTARLAEQAGFTAGYISGAATAASRGMPDMSVLTVSELLDAVRVARASSDLDLVVDGDTGFGGGTAIRRLVRDLEQAGVAAVHIEDQEFPRRCGYLAEEPCVPIREMLARLRAARSSTNCLVIARTDALLTEGIKPTIDRIRAYRTAGAEMVMVNGITTITELERIAAESPGPLLYNVSGSDRSPRLSVHDAARYGVALIIYPIHAARAATAATKRVFEAIAADQPPPPDLLMPFREYMDIAGFAEADRFERGLAEQE